MSVHTHYTARVTLAPGQLNRVTANRYAEVLSDHGIDSLDVATNKVALVYACLNCCTVGVADDNESRINLVDNFDFQCCGVTVLIDGRGRFLVNPDKLTLVRQEA